MLQIFGTLRQVRAVDREACQQLRQRVFGAAEVRDQASQPAYLRLQDAVGNRPLARADHRLEIHRRPGQLGVQRGQRLLTGGVDEDAAYLVQRVVAGRPRDRPRSGQRLTRLQDLLHDQPGPRRAVGQPVQVPAGIGQTVRVVDPQALDRAALDPA